MSDPTQRNLNIATGFCLLPVTVRRVKELLDELDAEQDELRAEVIRLRAALREIDGMDWARAATNGAGWHAQEIARAALSRETQP